MPLQEKSAKSRGREGVRGCGRNDAKEKEQHRKLLIVLRRKEDQQVVVNDAMRAPLVVLVVVMLLLLLLTMGHGTVWGGQAVEPLGDHSTPMFAQEKGRDAGGERFAAQRDPTTWGGDSCAWSSCRAAV